MSVQAKKLEEKKENANKFKYNPCVGSRQGDENGLVVLLDLNTTLVSVQVKRIGYDVADDGRFKYNPCVGSRCIFY